MRLRQRWVRSDPDTSTVLLTTHTGHRVTVQSPARILAILPAHKVDRACGGRVATAESSSAARKLCLCWRRQCFEAPTEVFEAFAMQAEAVLATVQFTT